jgi:hypothetical protein
MKQSIDQFQGQIAAHFRELILAMAYLNIGGQMLAGANPEASVELFLDEDIRTEPLHVRELLPHSGAVGAGALELYQNKMIAGWSDLLGTLFNHFVRAHVDGVQQYAELKKRAARIDFADATDFKTQLQKSLTAEFSFESYADRVRTVNSVLNPESKHGGELGTIKKHVLIRNAIQHHSSQVHGQMLRELGAAQVTLLDPKAEAKGCSLNERIRLSIPELDLLKRALFRLSNEWRNYGA